MSVEVSRGGLLLPPSERTEGLQREIEGAGCCKTP